MVLCIDTISRSAGIALVNPSVSLSEIVYKPLDPMRSSEGIMETIDEVLEGGGITPKALTGVLVIKGPGSFTGLRVGISVANQFAHQLNIPIVGLRVEEWWKYRTNEPHFAYLQSINSDELYIAYYEDEKEISSKIIPIQELMGDWKWLGQLSEAHYKKLPPSFQEITAQVSPEETWRRTVENTAFKKSTTYELVEPFYGKEAKITKSKKLI